MSPPVYHKQYLSIKNTLQDEKFRFCIISKQIYDIQHQTQLISISFKPNPDSSTESRAMKKPAAEPQHNSQRVTNRHDGEHLISACLSVKCHWMISCDYKAFYKSSVHNSERGQRDEIHVYSRGRIRGDVTANIERFVVSFSLLHNLTSV